MATKKRRVINLKCVSILFVIIFLVYCVLCFQAPLKLDVKTALSKMKYVPCVDLNYLITNLSIQFNETENIEAKYVVNSSKCKIRDINPFNPEILPYYKPKKYVKCRTKSLLTYVKKENNVATLYIDKRLVKAYTSKNIHCCVRTINRGADDNLIDYSSCKAFSDNITMTNDFALVRCTDYYDSEEVYENTHATITIKEEIKKKMDQHDKENNEYLSVLLVGIDSISRMNLERSLPLTHSYLKENDWLEFKGYNKIDDNTFPNLMAIMTGLKETVIFCTGCTCNPRVVGNLNNCSMLWYDYRKLGFITAYIEDETHMSTFNYLKKGFKCEPTDYYFRPYMLASEKDLHCKLMDGLKYCTGPETTAERIFNIAREFTSTFKKYPNFGLFWMNSYSHDEINAVSRMDEKIVDFLVDINQTDVVKNSLVIFFSDHGFRFGKITYTQTGWLEERLPFFYMAVPRWFREKYPRKYENLIKNTERLTSPFDVYLMLQEILVLSGKKYEVKKSEACPKCKSLFEEAEQERSCEDAGIDHQWCTCGNYLTIPSSSLIAKEVAKFVISEIRKAQINTGDEFRWCTDFELKQIISIGISDTNYTLHKNVSLFLVTFQTIPEAVFRGTVSIDMGVPVPSFKLEGSISRLDKYAEHSWCVNDSILKKYCYCNSRYGISNFVDRIKKLFSFT